MIRKTLFVWFLLAISGAGATGQSELEPGSKAWVEAQIERARNFKIPKGFRFKWREETHRLMTDAELAQARERVASKPDHPDRFAIMGEEQRIERGPDKRELEVLYDDSARWRFNMTTVAPNRSYADMALDGSEAWQLTAAQSQTIDASAPPRGYEPSSRQAQFERPIQRFVIGPFDFGTSKDYEVLNSTTEPNGDWSAHVQRVDGKYLWVLRGYVGKDGVTIKDRQLFASKKNKLTLQSIAVYSDRGTGDFFSVPIYHRIVGYFPDGKVIRTVREVVSVENLDPDVMRKAMQPPKPNSIDLIRGKLAVKEFVDFSSGVPVITNVNADGSKSVSRPFDSTASSSNWSVRVWKAIGWISGAFIVVLGIFLWRQRQRA